MSQNLRGTEGAVKYQGHNEEMIQNLKKLAVEKIGSLDNLDIFPRNSNPF